MRQSRVNRKEINFMSTKPNDIVRVRARANGRASVYEANAWCQSLSQGVLDGNGVIQNTSADMNVLVGGTSSKPDVVIASNPSGYKVALDIVGQQAVAITAPASNKRITSIVAYTDDLSLASTDTSITGSPSSCGLIVVNGTASASPSAPDDATIRTAITADGATGSQACYCVLAEILVDHTTTTITNSLIDNKISGVNQIADLAVKSNSIDFTTIRDNVIIETGTIAAKTVTTSYTNMITYTIPEDGIYLIWGKGTRSNNSADGLMIAMRFRLDSVLIEETIFPTVKNYRGNVENITTLFSVAKCKAGQSLAIDERKDIDAGPMLGLDYTIAKIC